MTLIYGIVRREPIIIMGQALALVIYARNLILIFRGRERRGQVAEPDRVIPSAAKLRRPASRIAAAPE